MGAWAGRFLTIDLSICETRPESCLTAEVTTYPGRGSWHQAWHVSLPQMGGGGNVRHREKEGATWNLRCINILDVEAWLNRFIRGAGGGGAT